LSSKKYFDDKSGKEYCWRSWFRCKLNDL
jgi:hypothetical protein